MSAQFLPKNIAQVLDLLAITSLDQKFDVETVASEAKVVCRSSISTDTMPTVRPSSNSNKLSTRNCRSAPQRFRPESEGQLTFGERAREDRL
jgi:hypothetical protein